MSVRPVRAYSTDLSKAIIERVKDHPEIWQFSHPMYRKRFVHMKFWEDMAVELGVNDKILKKRWKHLKEQYRKELKKSLEKDQEDSVCWQFFEPLSFYKQEVLHRVRERAVAAAIDADESPDESEEEASSPSVQETDRKQSKTLKRVHVLKKKTDDSMKLNAIYKELTQTKSLLQTKLKELETRNEDPDYMFLVSLLPSMKQLSDVQKLQLRGKINSWLLDALTVKAYVNACDPEDNEDYIPTTMEIIKCESE